MRRSVGWFLLGIFVLLLKSAQAYSQLPPTPAHVQGVHGDGYAIVSWDEVPGVTQYTVYGLPEVGVSKTHYIYSQKNTRSAVYFSGLTNNVTYFFVVTASNASGESHESSKVSIVPGPVPL